MARSVALFTKRAREPHRRGGVGHAKRIAKNVTTLVRGLKEPPQTHTFARDDPDCPSTHGKLRPFRKERTSMSFTGIATRTSFSDDWRTTPRSGDISSRPNG